jgi:hypothetical protein
MPTIKTTVTCPVHDSFRVQQVAGMFDVPLAEKATERFEVDVPGTNEEWQIGLIVGPSGSGKSTIARRAFGESLYTNAEWPSDRAVIDCFEDLSVRYVVELFTAVGFGSPPSWVKPYQVLSNGERFRCDLARALAEGYRLSTVDHTPSTPSDPEPTTESQRRRPQRRQGLLGRDRQRHPPWPSAMPIRRYYLPLRRRCLARARLDRRHGDL